MPAGTSSLTSPPQHQSAAQLRHIPGITIPPRAHLSTIEEVVAGSSHSHAAATNPAAAAGATTTPSQPQSQAQSQSQSRSSDATLVNHASSTAVSITASHPYARNVRLSPQVEEDIKAALLEAALAQSPTSNHQQGRNSGKKNGRDKRRRPDGRKESLKTTRNWLIAKKVLRWVSLTICALMVVGEAVLAIFDGAYADTALGICLGFLLGIWDTVRLVRLRLKRDIEPVSVFHLLTEGTFTVAIIIAVACIIDQVRRFWENKLMIRGWVFCAGMLVQEAYTKLPRVSVLGISPNILSRGVHITLFARACVDMYLHRDAMQLRQRYGGWELPWFMEPQPTEVVVKYVHVCPKCECEFSPHDEDKSKERPAGNGDM
ncbi:hypothetical protein DL771_008790 [Monosporascus sp. 5C6A]|nr:hypothetical protein DL771_008790 [Monosporascus sp. 5C6A]